MSTFEQMEELAKDRSQEGRRQLLRVLTDMFFDNSGDGVNFSSENYSDIVARVLDEVIEEARAEFSARVAPEKNFPKTLILKLAWDSFTVASPVLEYSPVLEDDDLVDVALEKSDKHLLAISRRSELHEAVTNVLVDRGNQDVVQSVAANPGAEFSERGIGALANKARADEKLQETLVMRPDVSSDIVAQLEPYLSEQLKERLTITIQPTKNDVTALVSRARERVESVLVGKKRDKADADKILAEVRAGKATLSEIVEKLAQQKRPQPLAAVIAGIAELSEKTVSNAMFKHNGIPIAITCRALDVTPEAFGALANMRCEVLKMPESTAEHLVRHYAELDQEDAERTVRFLKVRQSLSEDAA